MSNSVPDGWQIKKLRDLADPRSSNVDKNTDASEIPVRLCNYTDVYYKNRITSSIEFMEASAKQREIDRFSLEKGDVIITKDSETPGDIAVPSYVSEDLNGVICGYHLTLLKPNRDEASGEFLAHLFQLPSVQHYFYVLANGITRFGLTADSISEAPLLVPPLPEQKKIAAILTTVDDVIEKTQAQIDKLTDLKTGMMQDLLTQGIGLDGKPHTEFKKSPAGRIPVDWSLKPLQQIVDPKRPITYGIVQTGDHLDVGVPCVRVVDMTKSYLNPNALIKTSPDISKKFSRTVLKSGDIMFALRGVIGHVLVVGDELEGANLTRGVALISSAEEVEPQYLMWALKGPYVRSQIMDGVNGSALQEIPLSNLRNILVPLPDVYEQKRIAITLNSVTNKSELVGLKLKRLRNLKKGLMQDLLTGKVRVKVDQEEQETALA